MELKSYIRDIPDFPVPGILFRDITPLLGDSGAMKFAIDSMMEMCEAMRPDVIVSVESRGFLFAAPLAYRMGKPLVPVRKPGKLPYDTYSATYELEYGTDSLEIHRDAISAGQRALIVDDLLATGRHRVGDGGAGAGLRRGGCGIRLSGRACGVERQGAA